MVATLGRCNSLKAVEVTVGWSVVEILTARVDGVIG
ncbi:hypothetical protein LAUMK136_05620 [Mycobacterium attenuatum]|uniref:Uncharacterized protein n=1 Tax=Mycobacterium attenuatum TaxID=2341086 RepID=A0A498QIS7_9MYCO|nr:hypothetical protein LAUMK136_05620 [Mycobacterium attenuatum]